MGTIRAAYGTTQQHPCFDRERDRVRYRDRVPFPIPRLLRPEEPAEAGGDRGGGVPLPGGACPRRPPPSRQSQAPRRHRRQRLLGREHTHVRRALIHYGT